MGTLSGAISTSMQGLLANQSALDVTSRNIANSNTPGYSREVVTFTPKPDGGVDASFQSVRNDVIELQMNSAAGQNGQLTGYLNGMTQVANLVDETQGTGLQDVLGKFFASLQQLSADPTNATLRQSVILAGQNLTTAVRGIAKNLTQIQAGLNQAVAQDVTQVNQLTTQLAKLNVEIATNIGLGQDTSTLVDQRTTMIRQLSGLIDTQVTNASDGTVTVSTAGGASLVVGGTSNPLLSSVGPDANEHVLAGTTDITGSIQSGEIAGLLAARDQGIPQVQSQLDAFADDFGAAFNMQHAAGYDLSGKPGGNFFAPFVPSTPGSVAGAASQFTVAITDPNALAASATGASGDNGNLQILANLNNTPMVAGQSVTSYYSNLVQTVGNSVQTATGQQHAQALVR
jgi:flagellar hook-associated protein 1 FlgK